MTATWSFARSSFTPIVRPIIGAMPSTEKRLPDANAPVVRSRESPRARTIRWALKNARSENVWLLRSPVDDGPIGGPFLVQTASRVVGPQQRQAARITIGEWAQQDGAH